MRIYDALGRLSQTTQKLTDAAYLAQVNYDNWGRPLQQIAKRGSDAAKVFDLRYNAFGFPARVERAGLVLSQVTAQDAANRPTLTMFGNGLTQARTYNVYTAHLDDAALRTAANEARLHEVYLYDAIGSITQRNQYWSATGFQETFAYDDLNRLSSSWVLG